MGARDGLGESARVVGGIGAARGLALNWVALRGRTLHLSVFSGHSEEVPRALIRQVPSSPLTQAVPAMEAN